ncbi:MAG: hypothetical protein ACE5HE_15235, partial [Phycisphaerae bacterium]
MIPFPGREVTEELLGGSPVAFAEMPGVHNLFAPVEPYLHEDGRYYFNWVTDVGSLSRTSFPGATRLRDPLGLPTDWPNGVAIVYPLQPQDDIVPVDADGDGIVDSVQAELRSTETPPAPPPGAGPGPQSKWFMELDAAHLDKLRKTVNSRSNPTGKVFLGLRIVAHGGMVDLNHSHEALIRTALWYHGELKQTAGEFHAYDPTLEEPLLRRRNLLPPRLLPPSRIQGSALNFNDPLNWGGDFFDHLFPRGEAPRPGEHRYQPFAPDETDESGLDLLWALRMDADRVDPNEPLRSQYDWRHLVTTVSRDDLLRRETWIEEEVTTASGTGRRIKRMDVLDRMVEANKQHLNTRFPGWDSDYPEAAICWQRQMSGNDVLPFEYAAYPQDDVDHRDTYRRPIGVTANGEPIDSDLAPGMLADWCKCQGDPACTVNRVKGKLRLSLPWLDEALDTGVIGIEQRNRLIQDAFTMMLLSARSPQWGEWQNVDLNNDGDRTNDAFDADRDGYVLPGEGVPRVWEYTDTPHSHDRVLFHMN